MIETTKVIAADLGVKPACQAVGTARSSFYQRLRSYPKKIKPAVRKSPVWALTTVERADVLETLHQPRFVDKAPHQVYATLLDEGKFLCSIRTMYCILHDHDEVRERRNVARRPNYQRPELLATAPNQVWSWDITKLKTYQKWTLFYLYVIMDVFSRYVVGWMVAYRESATLAEKLISETCRKQQILPGQLTIHADRGSSMTSKTVAELMADLGVLKTHSRPYVSNDNPFSEAQFKTMKYAPAFPDRFGTIVEARSFGNHFFRWYNTEHRHTGIALLTPETVHYGRTEEVVRMRNEVLQEAFLKHPERFKMENPGRKLVPRPSGSIRHARSSSALTERLPKTHQLTCPTFYGTYRNPEQLCPRCAATI